ncbi:hypothetical protein EA473_14890 [Natrarchaeobius chitinivorans]|uniref:Uncharacterized protein n=1 Tax=Natrarchaeobius chitinivorans TaxID=1679083 RepID=A0A3N6MB35_NATCH|nr:hypothetical protein EA473_14890 [Natrarchaeobius chitinivorans]
MRFSTTCDRITVVYERVSNQRFVTQSQPVTSPPKRTREFVPSIRHIPSGRCPSVPCNRDPFPVPPEPRPIVTTGTIYPLIARQLCDQVCIDFQWLL